MSPKEEQYRIIRCNDITKATLLRYLSLTEIPKPKWSWSDVELFARIDAHLDDCDNCAYKFHQAAEDCGVAQSGSLNLQQDDESNVPVHTLGSIGRDRGLSNLAAEVSEAVERLGGNHSASERQAFADGNSRVEDGMPFVRPDADTLIRLVPRVAAAAEDDTTSTILGTLPVEVIRHGRSDLDDIGVTIMPRVTSTGMLTMNLVIPQCQKDNESFALDLIVIHPDGSHRVIETNRIVGPGHEVDLLVPLSEDLQKAWSGQQWKWADIPLRLRLTAVRACRERGPAPPAEAASLGPVSCPSRSI